MVDAGLGSSVRLWHCQVSPDLYFYRDLQETEKEEQGAAIKAVTQKEG